jgi:tRNA(adenine34) deaminase
MKEELNHEHFMKIALDEAQKALDHGEVPVGCVIVGPNDEILGKGFNCPISTHDVTAHAEIIAIRQACDSIKNYRLPKGSRIYVTLEPCLMCTGALLQSRISSLHISTIDSRKNSIHREIDLFNSEYFNHKIEIHYGNKQSESKKLLDDFFSQRRK